MNIRARLKKLEKRKQSSSDRIRVVISRIDRPPNLANCKCRRTLASNGLLTEVVELDGSSADLTDEDLERFISSFPVEVGA